MKEHEGIEKLYEALRPDCFEWDSLEDRLLRHKRIPLSVELPSELEKGAATSVHMMASIATVKSPEEGIRGLRLLMVQRDCLRQRGYQHYERFAEYGDGVEYIYDIPTESQDDLAKMLSDLRFE